MSAVGIPPVSAAGPRYAERYTEQTLAAELSLRLAGRPANGSARAAGRPASVIWVDAGSDVLVHLDSVKAQIADGTVLVSVDLECDQTGRTPLVVVLAVGKSGDPAGLFAVTDELPRGNGMLAARWGAIVQTAVWASLLGLVTDFSAERGAAPAGMAAAAGALTLIADQPAVRVPGVNQ